MSYDNSFANYGFLSCEADGVRFSEVETYAESFLQAREAVLRALHGLPAGGDYRSPPGVLAAIGFWQQCIESSQAAIVLADRGMPTPAMSVLRTAVENLFYFAALIKNPSLFERLMSVEKYAKHKQASGMLKACVDGLSQSDVRHLHEVLRDNEGGKDWSVYDAAQKAEMLDFYQSAYRGLSAMGAHATTQSLERHFSMVDGLAVVQTQPSDYALRLVLKTVCSCLAKGVEIFDSERHKSVITRGMFLGLAASASKNSP